MAKAKQAKAVHQGPKRAAIYTRVSSEEQATEGTSLGVQEATCRARVEAEGWAVVDVFTDAGISGAKREDARPALAALMAAVEGGKVDAVVITKVDRLGRSIGLLANLWDRLAQAEVALVPVLDPTYDDTTPGGRMYRTVMGAMAELERDMIRDRTSSGRIARLKDGGWAGGDAPMGFSVDRSSGHPRLVIDETEAVMVRRAVSLLLDHGMTTGEAAAALNAEGYAPRKAARWDAGLLRNHLTRGAWGGVWTYAKPAGRTKTEALTVAIPPMLDADRHAALLAYLKVTTSPKTRSHVHPLSGLLIGQCGHQFTGVARSDRGRRRYRCSRAKATTRGWSCPAHTILADALDDAVWAEVLKVLRDPSLLQAAAADYLGVLAGSAEAEADALVKADAEVVKCETALAGAFSAGLKAGLDSVTLDRVVSDLKADLAEARSRAQAIRAMQEQTGAQAAGLAQVQALVIDVEDRLETADAALRSEVFRALGVEVRVPALGAEGEPLSVQVNGTDVLGVLGVFAGQGASPRDRGDLSLSNHESAAVAAGIWQRGQDALLRGYADRYAADLPTVWATRSPQVAGSLSVRLFPATLIDPLVLQRTAVLLDEGHPAGLRRYVAEQRDDLARALAARRASGTT